MCYTVIFKFYKRIIAELGGFFVDETTFSELVERSKKLRARYHELEIKHHEDIWTVEEDALAFLTDAGLVGRLTMTQQERWPSSSTNETDLELKIGETMWWLIVLAERMSINSSEALEKFLSTTEKRLER